VQHDVRRLMSVPPLADLKLKCPESADSEQRVLDFKLVCPFRIL